MRRVETDEVGELRGASVLDLRALHRTSGYPSPAQDYAEAGLDVRDLLVRRPAATFFARMEGDALRGAGISAGDILVIDRSLPPLPGSIIVAVVEGELVVRRYRPGPHGLSLLSAHPDYPSIRLPAGAPLDAWGVVTYAIHRCTPTRRE